jgi:hypothetical protein
VAERFLTRVTNRQFPVWLPVTHAKRIRDYPRSGLQVLQQFGAKLQIHLFEQEKNNDGCLVNIGIE